MRRARTYPPLVLSLLLLLSAASGCTREQEGEEISFRLDGQLVRLSSTSAYLSSSINRATQTLTISASEFAGFGTVGFVVQGYRGPGVYSFEAGSSAGYTPNGWFHDDPSYTTALPGGSGWVSVRGERCSARTGRDIATGILATTTWCEVNGAFEFVAVNEQRETKRITHGRFGVRIQERE